MLCHILSGHVVKLRGETKQTKEMELYVHVSDLFIGAR